MEPTHEPAYHAFDDAEKRANRTSRSLVTILSTMLAVGALLSLMCGVAWPVALQSASAARVPALFPPSVLIVSNRTSLARVQAFLQQVERTNGGANCGGQFSHHRFALLLLPGMGGKATERVSMAAALWSLPTGRATHAAPTRHGA